MINGIISKYLGVNKRLVVPELGAFIRKEGGEVAFVEFLKKDDGVLATLIANELGLAAEEAAEVLAGYVDGVRRAVAMSGRYIVDGVGVVASDANGLLSMGGEAAASEPVMEVVEVVREEVVTPLFRAPEPEPEPVPAFREPEPVNAWTPPVATKEPVVEPVWASRPEPTPEPAYRAPEPVNAWTPPVAPKEPEQAFADTFSDKKAFTINDLYSSPEPEEEEESAADWFSSPEQAREYAPQRPQIRRRPPQKRNKTDLVMIIAIIAAVLAIGSMVIGMLSGGNPAVRQSTEQVVDSLGVEVVEAEVTE